MAAEPMTVNGGTCPSLETIGAFVDGRFKDRERDVIAEHVASCEACYFVFTEAARMRVAQAAAVPVPLPARRNTWRLAAAGLAAAATIVLAVNMWGSFGANGERRALDQLVAAVGTARTFEPRLTGGFAYAPVRAVRGPNDPPALSPDVRIAIAEIEKQNSTRPIAATASLIGGDPNRAIEILESATRSSPDDARIFSDLSAAYLVRSAQRSDAARDVQMALAMANRAIEIDRLLPEALFNRALALQANGLKSDARAAWQAYLTIDDRSGWADEARVRLRILSNQP